MFFAADSIGGGFPHFHHIFRMDESKTGRFLQPRLLKMILDLGKIADKKDLNIGQFFQRGGDSLNDYRRREIAAHGIYCNFHTRSDLRLTE